jgi:hypothetical protein
VVSESKSSSPEEELIQRLIAENPVVVSKDNLMFANVQLHVCIVGAFASTHSLNVSLQVFSKTYCPYSSTAKDVLTSEGARFHVVELDTRADGTKIQVHYAHVCA